MGWDWLQYISFFFNKKDNHPKEKLQVSFYKI